MSEWKCEVCGRGHESCWRNNAGELVHICLGCKPEDFKVVPDWIAERPELMRLLNEPRQECNTWADDWLRRWNTARAK